MQAPERYFQVLLALHNAQDETFSNGLLTWVDWSRTDSTGVCPGSAMGALSHAGSCRIQIAALLFWLDQRGEAHLLHF